MSFKKIAKKLFPMLKIAYGYPAEVNGEAYYMHIPIRYNGHYMDEFGIVFDIRFGKHTVKNLNSTGGYKYSGTTHPIPDEVAGALQSIYNKIYIDMVVKTAKKYDIELPTQSRASLRFNYDVTEKLNIVGPGFTEEETPVTKCTECDITNEYVDYDPFYVCPTCKSRKEWSLTASSCEGLINIGRKFEELFKIAFIKHLSNGKWQVQSRKGKNLGTYKTKAEAKKRLRQVEFFKHKGK